MGHSNLAIKPLGNLVHIRGLKEKENNLTAGITKQWGVLSR